MTSVLKSSITANQGALVDGQTVDAADVSTPISDLVTHHRNGRVSVSAADLNVKDLIDALLVSAGLTKPITNPGADEAITITLDTKLQALIAFLSAAGKLQVAGHDSGAATNGQVLTANGTGGAAWVVSPVGSVTAAYEDGALIVNGPDRLDFKDLNVEASGLQAHVYLDLNVLCQGRLTLTTALPMTTADVLAATQIYFTPYKGNKIALFDGTRWKLRPFTEITIKLTDTQNGTTTNASAVVTALTDTSQFIVGMEVTGTGIPVSTTILSIDSATQITLSAAATASGVAALTFKVAAGKNLDVFCFNNAGTPKLEFAAWTNDTTRATALVLQDGVQVKSAATTRRYLGTIRTTATAGQTEDSLLRRFVWNYYHRVRRIMRVREATNTWTYAVVAWRAVNASVANRVEFVWGAVEEPIYCDHNAMSFVVNAQTAAAGVGLDSTTVNSAQIMTPNYNADATNAFFSIIRGIYEGYPAVGYHFLQALEKVRVAAVTITFYGTGGSPDDLQHGMYAWIMG